MPDGQTHLRLWKKWKWTGIAAAIFVTALSIPYADPGQPFWLMIGPAIWLGYLLGYYIDPDLDQANTTASEWRLMRDLGIIGSLIVGWFVPYGMIMKHRSFVSHFPVISTSLRFVWFLAFPPVALFLWFTRPWIPEYWPVFSGIFTGLALADMVHYLADEGLINYRRKK